MKFIKCCEIDVFLRDHGIRWVLQNYGRYRIGPGFTVADYVKTLEFFRTAHRPRRHNPHTGSLEFAPRHIVKDIW